LLIDDCFYALSSISARLNGVFPSEGTALQFNRMSQVSWLLSRIILLRHQSKDRRANNVIKYVGHKASCSDNQ